MTDHQDPPHLSRRYRDGSPRPAAPGRAPVQNLDLDVLNAFLDGRLDPTERAAAADHLAGCAACRGELAELRATVALLRGLPQYAPRRSFRLGAEHAGAAARAEGRLARWLPALPALRAATAAVAVLLLVAVAGDLASSSRDDPSPAVAPAFVAPTAATRSAQGQAPAPAPALFEEESAAGGTESGGAASDEVGVPLAAAESTAAAQEVPPAAVGGAQDAEQVAPSAVGGPAAGDDTAAASGEADDGGPSVWRLAQVGLGLLLLWLLVGVVGLERLNRRPHGPGTPG